MSLKAPISAHAQTELSHEVFKAYHFFLQRNHCLLSKNSWRTVSLGVGVIPHGAQKVLLEVGWSWLTTFVVRFRSARDLFRCRTSLRQQWPRLQKWVLRLAARVAWGGLRSYHVLCCRLGAAAPQVQLTTTTEHRRELRRAEEAPVRAESCARRCPGALGAQRVRLHPRLCQCPLWVLTPALLSHHNSHTFILILMVCQHSPHSQCLLTCWSFLDEFK